MKTALFCHRLLLRLVPTAKDSLCVRPKFYSSFVSSLTHLGPDVIMAYSGRLSVLL